MKQMLLLLSILIPINSYSFTIDCYSGGKKIYHEQSKNVYYESHVVIVQNKKNTTFLFSNCIIKQ
jgi:hypothetical protein